jgi:hypothetical protein
MPFEITVHPEERIIEIAYPARPTMREVEEYVAESERMIAAQGPGWTTLADERQVRTMAPTVAARLAELNLKALQHGLRRSARLVSTAASLKITMVARSAAGNVPVRTFETREAALAWLREEA